MRTIDRLRRRTTHVAARQFRCGVGLRVVAVILLVVAAGCGPSKAAVKAAAAKRGDAAVEKQQDRVAIAAYLEAVDADPLDGAVRLKLAYAYMRTQQWGDAAAQAIRASDLLPGHREARLLGISMMLSSGRFVDAADRSAVLLRENANDVDALLLHGNATARLLNTTWALYKLDEARRLGRNYSRARSEIRPLPPPSADQAAEQTFRRALQLAPDSIDAQFALVNLFWAIGQPEQGEPLLKQIAERNPGHGLANRSLAAFYIDQARDREAEVYLKSSAAHDDRDALMALGDLYLLRGRYAEAIGILEPAAVGTDPGFGAALRMAEIELRLNRLDQATQRLDVILAREAHHPRALLLRARTLLAARQIDRAVTVARAAVAADTTSSAARTVLGETLAAAGNPEAAFLEYAQAFRIEPKASRAPKELARLSIMLGRSREAVEFSRQVLREHPDDEDARFYLVQGLVRLRQFEEAERLLRPLLASRPSRAELWVVEGQIHAAKGRLAAAHTSYQRALVIEPDSFDALAGQIAADLTERQVARARQRLDRALPAHPDAPPYLMLSARVATAAKDRPRADSTLRRVLELDPGHVDAARQLAEMLAADGRADEAVRVIDQVLVRRPAALDAQQTAADLLLQSGRVDEARVRYERIVTADSRAALAGARLAAIHADHGGNLDTALTLASKAKQERPDDPAISDVLGWVYVKKGLAQLGLPHLRDATTAVPGNPDFAYHLGIAYWRASRYQSARDELTRALALAPNASWAAEAKQALVTLSR